MLVSVGSCSVRSSRAFVANPVLEVADGRAVERARRALLHDEWHHVVVPLEELAGDFAP